MSLDLDLKLAGREDEIVAALKQRDLLGRAMVSTMEVPSLAYLREHEPSLRRGWTLPKVRRDWTRSAWGRPLVLAASATLRARLPGIVRRRAPALGAWAVWVYHPLVTRRLVASAHGAGVRVIAWTVDEPERIDQLTALGIDGICTNDPRLLARALEALRPGGPRSPGPGAGRGTRSTSTRARRARLPEGRRRPTRA